MSRLFLTKTCRESNDILTGEIKWGRRRHFTLFLVCQGYLHCSVDLSTHEGEKEVTLRFIV